MTKYRYKLALPGKTALFQRMTALAWRFVRTRRQLRPMRDFRTRLVCWVSAGSTFRSTWGRQPLDRRRLSLLKPGGRF
eukprot:2434537-Pyramimonas_sp.AAC.1